VAAALLVILSACGSQPSTGPALGQRPNIVFILTDDLSTNLVRFMPQVMRMEQAGMTMSRSYVVDSLCCPSRTATLTGEYPHDDGVFMNGTKQGGYSSFLSHGDQLRTFGLTLHNAGYRTGFMGKYINGYHPNSDAPNPGWDEWDAVGWGYPEFNYHMNVNGRLRWYGSAPKDYLTDVLAQKATKFIDTARSVNRPFALEVATFAPHAPYVPAPRYAGALPGLHLPRTPAFDRLPAHAPSWLAPHPPLRASQIAILNRTFLQRVRADLAVDDLIGRIFEALTRNHLLRNTYVVFSSDNGFHLGEYRLTGGKETAFDTDVRVPLVVDGPGVPAGRVAPQLAANIDLAPTFDVIGRAPVPSWVDGTSLLRVWHGERPAVWQQAVLVEHHQPPPGEKDDPDLQSVSAGRPPSYEAVRSDNALLVRYQNGEIEYYRTDRDPYELHNLGAAAAPPGLLMALDRLGGCHGRTACQEAAQVTR
jgi:arylsulfatase A-like enzyme